MFKPWTVARWVALLVLAVFGPLALPVHAADSVPAPPWSDGDEAAWSVALAALHGWQKGCNAAACVDERKSQACTKRAGVMAKALGRLPPAVRARLIFEELLPWRAGLQAALPAGQAPGSCAETLGTTELEVALEAGQNKRALVQRAMWTLQALRAGDPVLRARCGTAAGVATVEGELLEFVERTDLAPVCAGLGGGEAVCAAAWLAWFGPRALLAEERFTAALTELRWAKALALTQEAVEGTGERSHRAYRQFNDHPELRTHPAVLHLARHNLARDLDPELAAESYKLVQLVGIRNVLHFAVPGRPASDWRWAQVQIPPPKSSPVPPPEGATPAAAAPQLPKAMAKALAKQRRDLARNKIRYAGCAYEHQGFTGEEFCQDWQVAPELDPVLAAHLLDQELFASGGALNLQVCSDSADFRWPLDVVFLNNLKTLENRPLLLRLLTARAAALLAQPSGPPTARVEALIANFLAVAQIPLCDGQAGPAAERPARLAACLTTWVRWTAVHAKETWAQTNAFLEELAHTHAASRDPADWALLVVKGACMGAAEPSPAWFWAARNLLLDVAAPPNWSELSDASALHDYRTIFYPPPWLGLQAVDLLAPPRP